MKFSYSAVWDDTVRLVREHGALLGAIAGVFIFLPSLLLSYLVAAPEAVSADPQEAFQISMDYYRANVHWFLLVGIIAMWGSLAMLRLVFPRQATVAGAISAAIALLPFYLLVSIISGFIIGIGLFLLILPGLYLAARLIVAAPVMVAEDRRNPLDVISRSFAVTKGRGWAILGLLVLIVIAAVVVMVVVNGMLGILFTLVAGQDLGRLFSLIIGAAISAAFTVLLTVLYAAIYRALAGHVGSTARVVE